ncbi:MAG: hypothetical protein JSS61_02570 [Verrucomicrobia bacterium]|nr:hypothetical protein [Verrucomicrobiota bacterium]
MTTSVTTPRERFEEMLCRDAACTEPMRNTILELFDKSIAVNFGKKFRLKASPTIRNHEFFGAANKISLHSEDSIVHECVGPSAACIAAPVVEMVASRSIFLGYSEEGTSTLPVVLYAPSQLSLTAPEIVIGNALLIDSPIKVSLRCKTLAFRGEPGSRAEECYDTLSAWAPSNVNKD